MKTIGNAKLTKADVEGLRYRVANGGTTRNEANRFNVGIETIRKAIRGDTFKDVPGATLSEEAVEVKGGEAFMRTEEEGLVALAKIQENLRNFEKPIDPNVAVMDVLAVLGKKKTLEEVGLGGGGKRERVILVDKPVLGLREEQGEEPRGNLLDE